MKSQYRKIVQTLQSKNFVKEFVSKYLGSEFKIKGLEIYTLKKTVTDKFYHLITFYIINRGQQNMHKIICSAFPGSSRQRTFKLMQYLYKYKDLFRPQIITSVPIAYMPEYGAMFYHQINGGSLWLNIMKKKKIYKSWLAEVGSFLAILHDLPLPKEVKITQHKMNYAFLDNTDILGEIKSSNKKYAVYAQSIKENFEHLLSLETSLFKNTQKNMVHGDMHPENVIIINRQTIGIIDYTDIYNGYAAADLGTFLQQLHFRARHNYQAATIRQWEQAFLQAYLKRSGQSLNKQLKKQITFFKIFTALRTCVYCLHVKEPQTIDYLLVEIKQNFIFISK